MSVSPQSPRQGSADAMNISGSAAASPMSTSSLRADAPPWSPTGALNPDASTFVPRENQETRDVVVPAPQPRVIHTPQQRAPLLRGLPLLRGPHFYFVSMLHDLLRVSGNGGGVSWVLNGNAFKVVEEMKHHFCESRRAAARRPSRRDAPP